MLYNSDRATGFAFPLHVHLVQSHVNQQRCEILRPLAYALSSVWCRRFCDRLVPPTNGTSTNDFDRAAYVERLPPHAHWCSLGFPLCDFPAYVPRVFLVCRKGGWMSALCSVLIVHVWPGGPRANDRSVVCVEVLITRSVIIKWCYTTDCIVGVVFRLARK